MKHEPRAIVESRRSQEIPAFISRFDVMGARWLLERGRPATLEVGLAMSPGKQKNFMVCTAATERDHIENDHDQVIVNKNNNNLPINLNKYILNFIRFFL